MHNPELDAAIANYHAGTDSLDTLLHTITDYAKRLAGRIDSRIDAEDVAQTVALQAWQHIDAAETITPALIFTITRRRTIDAQRQYRAPEEIVEAASTIDQAAPAISDAADIAIEVLGEQVIALMERGYTSVEISELTGVPASTIRSRIEKVRKMIRSSSNDAA